MARAHFVKKARKTHRGTGIKKGDSYYWWKFRYGGKHYSKTPPRQSQLTQSDFLSTVYEVGERFEDGFELSADGIEDAKNERDNAVDELRTLADEQDEKRSNMPDALQYGDTGQLLESRMDSCNEFADELENVDLEIEKEEGESEDDFKSRLEEVFNELSSCSYNGD